MPHPSRHRHDGAAQEVATPTTVFAQHHQRFAEHLRRLWSQIGHGHVITRHRRTGADDTFRADTVSMTSLFRAGGTRRIELAEVQVPTRLAMWLTESRRLNGNRDAGRVVEQIRMNDVDCL